MIYQTVQV